MVCKGPEKTGRNLGGRAVDPEERNGATEGVRTPDLRYHKPAL